MRSPRSLKCIGWVVLVAFQAACIVYSTHDPPPTDDELARLDPKGVVELYWKSALTGDTDTIKKIVGPPRDSMLWDCKPVEPRSEFKGTRYGQLAPVEPRSEFKGTGLAPLETPDKPRELGGDNQESILRYARVTEIDRKTLATNFNLAEYKLFGSEARLLHRPKDSPNPYNSSVFFLLNDGRWKIVDLKVEDHLRFVGNKKFGEPRVCPPTD